MPKDMIAGCFDGYTWNRIQYFVNSVNRSGFTGDKVMIVMGSDKPTVDWLSARGWQVVHYGPWDAGSNPQAERGPLTVHVLRFYYLARFLGSLPPDKKPRYVITADVKDVVFQENPVPRMEALGIGAGGKELIAASESIRYRDEFWGDRNLLDTFDPMLHARYRDETIYNVGVMAGTCRLVEEIAQLIFQLSLGRRMPVVDQAVYNYLLYQSFLASHVAFLPSEAGWACHLGISHDPTLKEKFAPFLLEPAPRIILDGAPHVETAAGLNYAIVHQYDRVPALKLALEAAYGDN
jgi:hypothetical protein